MYNQVFNASNGGSMKINLKGKNCVMIGNRINGRITNKNLFGKPHIIIEGCGSIVGDSVMNGRFYPLSEVRKIPDNTPQWIPAPFDHPGDENGNFIPSYHPLAITQNYGGVWSGNYRMDGDLLIRDIAINIEVAQQSEKGRELLRRIDAGEDVDTSTGLLFIPVDGDGYAPDGEPFGCTVTSPTLDHDAILLDQQGAATSNEGVGIFANSSDENEATAEVEFVTQINTSAPASMMRLVSGPYDEQGAITRIRQLTNSIEKPSRNYRKFFLQFDRNNSDSFDAYSMPFADVVNGVPVASEEQIKKYAAQADTLEQAAKDAINSYLSIASNSESEKVEQSLFDKIFAKVMNAIAPIDKVDYSDSVEPTNQQEDDPMKEKILAALNAAGVKTEGLNEDQLFAEFQKLNAATNSKQDNADIASVVAAAVNGAIKPLQDKINALETAANSSVAKETDALAAEVEALDIGLNAAAAKALGVDGMRSVLAKNSRAHFNVFAGNSRGNASDADLGSLPE